MTTQALDSLDELYAALKPLSLAAGWTLQTSSRLGSFQPAHWRYADVAPTLAAAGRLVDTELAERRNLVMQNPGNGLGTTATLVSAYQMILPGERARSHRHTAGALRLVIDALPVPTRSSTACGSTCFRATSCSRRTGVGTVTPTKVMRRRRGSTSSTSRWPCGLGQMVFQEYPDGFEPVRETRRDSLFVYAWEATQAALLTAPFDPRFGRTVVLDQYPMKTIGLRMSALDAGTQTDELREPVNRVYSVVAGNGHSVLGDREIVWSRGDVFAVPARCAHRHQAEQDAVLFCVSDEPVLAALDFHQL